MIINFRNKVIITSVIVGAVLSFTLFGVGVLLTNMVNVYVLGLTDKITQQIGHPVTIERVTTKWDWIFLRVSIKNLMVFDQVAQMPLFMAGEIVSTVDALDSLCSLSLKFKHLLLRSPRLVMQWNGIAPPAILGIGHENVGGDVNPAGVLKLLAMQRHITVENGDFHLQGKNGADLPFMGVKLEFDHSGNNEYKIIARGNIAAAVQPEFIIAINYYGALDNYDAAMLDFEIKSSNIQLTELFNFIPKYRQQFVQGDFADFDLKGTVQHGNIRSIKTDFNITKVTIGNNTIINGGTGHIDYVPGSNNFNIQLVDATVSDNSLFTKPIKFDHISGNIKYTDLQNGSWDILTQDAVIKLAPNGIEAHPEFSMHIADNRVQKLEINSTVTNATMSNILCLLPDKKMSQAVYSWLKTSLVAGLVDNVKLNYNDQKFLGAIAFKDVELKYSLESPSVTGIDATLFIEQDKFNLSVNHAAAKIPTLGVDLEKINGNIKFTNSSLISENLQLMVLGRPATASLLIEHHKPTALKMSVNTLLKIPELKKMLPSLDLSNLDGGANIMASLEVPLEDHNLNKILHISSDMVGVSVNYPPPLHKEAKVSMPLKLQYNIITDAAGTLHIKYATLLDAALFLKNNKLRGAHIAINKKLEDFYATDNLHIVGNIKKISWDDWQPLLQTNNTNVTLPIELDLTINALQLYGSEYESLKIKYLSKTTEIFIDSPILIGTIAMNQKTNKISIKLDKFNAPDQKISNNKLLEYLKEKRAANKLPLISISCDKLLAKKHIFKKINLELSPSAYGYEINNFSITNDHIKLQAQGRWQMDNKPFTTLSGNAYTNNFGKVMAEWGYLNSMSRGKGEGSFAVQWDGGPTDFDILMLDGTSHIDLRSGNLTNVNPGLGRIIGLLSLETIQRRLQLDFSDLLSRGFAFDKLVADVKLQSGKLTSENIFINSPAAKIEMYGKTAIKSKDLDFTMYVTPKVGASLPIAAAIAVGSPVVGAAIWLFDKASGSKISDITKYKYMVTGTWDAPKINEISESHNNAVGTG